VSAEVSIKIDAQQFLATVRGAVNDGLFASGLALQDAISIGNLAARRKALRQGAWGIAIAGFRPRRLV